MKPILKHFRTTIAQYEDQVYRLHTRNALSKIESPCQIKVWMGISAVSKLNPEDVFRNCRNAVHATLYNELFHEITH